MEKVEDKVALCGKKSNLFHATSNAGNAKKNANANKTCVFPFVHEDQVYNGCMVRNSPQIKDLLNKYNINQYVVIRTRIKRKQRRNKGNGFALQEIGHGVSVVKAVH